jgi:hypothetical protein
MNATVVDEIEQLRTLRTVALKIRYQQVFERTEPVLESPVFVSPDRLAIAGAGRGRSTNPGFLAGLPAGIRALSPSLPFLPENRERRNNRTAYWRRWQEQIGIPYGSKSRDVPGPHYSIVVGGAAVTTGPLFRSLSRHGQVQAGRLSGIEVARVVKKLSLAQQREVVGDRCWHNRRSQGSPKHLYRLDFDDMEFERFSRFLGPSDAVAASVLDSRAFRIRLICQGCTRRTLCICILVSICEQTLPCGPATLRSEQS